MSALTAALNKWLLFLLLTLCCFFTKAQLATHFTATPTSGCAPLLVAFTDSSTGNPTSWKWDLGNGTISFLRNPSVTYFAPGQYTVKLVIRNASGADSLTKVNYIDIHGGPNVEFSATPTSGCFPLPVQFTDQSVALNSSIISWEWDFGDGSISSLQNPSHTYSGVGNFNVTLRVKNSFGCTSILTKIQYIHIGSGVHAAFSHNPVTTCTPPVIINFQNLSTGVGVLTYQWSFGDGGTSVAANPTHSYNTPGSYTVRLIVTNAVGCTDTLTQPNSVTLGSVHADFTSPLSVCQGQAVNLINTSSPAPVSAMWSFGDGTTASSINANKTYNSTGNFIIKMVANFGTCQDSAIKNISVLTKPVLVFSGNNTSSCKPPLTVNFTSTVSGATTYSWNFGDGTSSSLANPSHTYTTYGTFTVGLTAQNSAGCADSLIKVGYIMVAKPVVTIPGLPMRGCAPFTYNFTTNINSVDSVVSYFWNFGDGTTSSLPNPSHTFILAGNYTIRVIINTLNGCSDTATVVNGIMVNNKPHANFSATPLDVCAFIPITFTDLTTGSPDQWLWNFGDAGTSTLQNPIHGYQDTGLFNVTLIVWTNGCPDTIKFVNYIHIKPPIAKFAIGLDCNFPMQRVFTDHSIGADTWSWNFGDSTSSTVQNPTHTYAAPGSYNVVLTVTNSTTGCAHNWALIVNVISEKSNFTASDTVVCKGSSIAFQTIGINIQNISLFDWNYGDGTSSAVYNSNPSHVYNVSGTYTVRLIITDLNGCMDTMTKQLYIKVYGPTASFNSAPLGTCINNTITFTDASTMDGTHPITTWIWNYGDGTIDTLTSPPFQHAYSSAGVYNISLKIKDNNGCSDSISRLGYITISKPVAGFTSDTLSCTSGIIIFTNTSTGPGLTYAWDFGDGSTSAVLNPVHQYLSQGLFTVSLNIFDQYGCTDNIVRTNFIHIANATANFNMSDSVTTCPPLIVLFTNTSVNCTNRTWDFGDGTTSSLDNPTHFYTSAGTYHVQLNITGPGGCSDQKIKTIIVRGPQGSFTYSNISGCKPLTSNFVATTRDNLSFIWDFSDGTTVATPDSIRSHTYVSAGSYLPKVILVDTIGCHVPISGIDTIYVYGVNADFNTNTPLLCDSGNVSFTSTATSNDIISAYQWTFGDGTTSALQNPVHPYNTTGIFNVRLVVTSQAGCVDTSLTRAPVKVVGSPQVAIAGGNGACIPATLNFNGLMIVPDTSVITWHWDFANGNTSALQVPPAQSYPNAGTYVISLVAMNSSGCKDSIIKTIQAYSLPTIAVVADTFLCRGTSSNFVASGASTYSWTPATGLSCSNCAQPVATPDSSTKYIVSGLSAQGCLGKDTVSIAVKQPFVMNVIKGDTLCQGRSVRLNAMGATTYVWSPSTDLSNPNIAQPVATPLVSRTYMVIGTDNRACFKDTGYVPIKVFPYPTVKAGVNKTINIGQSIDLLPTISNDVTVANWTPTSGVFRNNFPGVTVRPAQTTEYTIDVANSAGCKARDKVTIFVICNNANIFIPNTFSPNGDGMNDQFFIRGNGLFTIKYLKIFNRWGQVVYERSNVRANEAADGWDGTFKGQKLTPDVYVYTVSVICDNNQPLEFHGNIALIK